LIELNTPGGLPESTQHHQAHLTPPVIVIHRRQPGSVSWVLHPESADVAAMAPGTNTGAAHPVTLGGGKVDDVMKEDGERRRRADAPVVSSADAT
jgi:membrane-bound serine protease (ClpP class)